MNDEEILDLYWQRNEDAITETAIKYGNYCRHIAINILSNKEDAEECVNDTYMHTWDSIPPNRPNIFRTWIGRITRNLSIDRYKYHKAQKRSSNEVELILSELEECIPSSHNIEKEMEDQEVAKLINQFLEDLSVEKRTIFVRRYFFSDSVRQIAEKYGISENKVKSLLFRTRNSMRKFLEKEGIFCG